MTGTGAAVVPGAPVLAVDDLHVAFATAGRWLSVVDGVTFDLRAGEVLGLVGESGSGKSVTSLAVMGLLPAESTRVRGSIRLDGRELTELSGEAMRRHRGRDVSMIFQEPMSSLNPAFTIGNQIAETVRAHSKVSRAQANARAIEMLDLVGIPDPARRARAYPHAFSGGMRQRAMIAMALACEPKVLIADEPTTALDVTIQAQILELLRRLQHELGMAVIFVTHDLGVVADICDRVVVMYAGEVVERSEVAALFAAPAHPYSAALLDSMPQMAATDERLRVIPGQVPRPDALPSGCRFHPRCAHAVAECAERPVALVPIARNGDGPQLTRCARQPGLLLLGAASERRVATESPRAPADVPPRSPRAVPLLSVRGLTKSFAVHSTVLRRTIGSVRAVDGIDLDIAPGETLGLVGESGSGKSTVARLVVGLTEPTAGTVTLDGVDLATLGARALRDARRDLQIVFQDPYSSLDPRATIAESVGEPLEVHERVGRAERDQRVAELLEQVGLDRHMLRRYPHEFSGGQRQRIAIARALALHPKLVVCDEPVSSLDVSTQSQVINLFTELQDELGLAYLFIAHDLSVVRHISHRIAVMYLGRIVEIGAAEELSARPRHPYTEALLSAIPVPDPTVQRTRERIVLQGDVPSPLDPPRGCHFHTRCPHVMEICRTVVPDAFTDASGTTVHCHLHTDGPRLAGAPVTVLTGARAGA
ncbi:MAG TPA: ABC transporter ATP-binding protein [Acidimicrobiia bacterium]|nr:ABC transporter ATP-binding protein [Acidimicrobiia bacterium]